MAPNRPFLSTSSSGSPYRVGMAREAQRYIEPDEIYTDMSRGPATRIPRQFPFSWNPVNGLGATNDASSSGLLDDVFQSIIDVGTETGKEVIGDGKKSIEDRASQGIEDFLNSTPGKQLLDKVKDKAAEGVTGVVKDQAPNLILLAVAGGAVGGAISAKLGKAGTIMALVVAGWATMQIVNAKVPGGSK
jgi:hypothetical protein